IQLSFALFVSHEALYRFCSLVSAFRIQLAVGNPGARALSVGVADFTSASLDRDYRRRGVRADSGGSVSAGANSWGATPRLNHRRWRQTIAVDGLAKKPASQRDRRH